MVDRGNKILIVDDEADSIAFVASVVEDMGGYEVLTASDGEEAVKIARKERPALVITDLNMPVKDGYSAFVELQSDPATAAIPVIMLSSLTAVGEYVSMNPAVQQPKLFLDKPIDPGRLAAMIRHVLK